MALKFHLSSSYNYVRYNGKMKAQPIKSNEIWNINKIRNKLQDEESIREFFLYNIIHTFSRTGKLSSWVGDFANPESVAIWSQYRDWWSRPLENTIKDFDKLSSHTPRQLIDPANSHPIVIKRTMGGQMHINSLTVLFKDWNLKNHWPHNDPIMDDFIQVLDKYQIFFDIEKGIMKKVLEYTHSKV